MSFPVRAVGGPQPLLSVVVLVYNTAAYLRDCFDSLLNQEYRHIEIIAIDDSSTDASLAICQQYAAAHTNFRCISKPNEGGAVSGNLGMQLAQGEYVALVDSDDMVTPSGYRLMIEEALACDADITIGRAARLSSKGISAVAFLQEPHVWSRRRRLDSVHAFIDLHHDNFYWNKVFRTAFLREFGLGMVPGLLYADRPFVHACYWHSKRTAIITDLVYLWRVREGDQQPSISQNSRQADNFRDRIRSSRLEWEALDKVAEAQPYRDAIATSNLQRALYSAPALVSSPRFRVVFLEEMRGLLALYAGVDWRGLGARRCLYIALIQDNQIEALCFLLGVTSERGWIRQIGESCYWQQPFLDNPEIPIPREVMRLDFPNIGFFQLCDVRLDGSSLSLVLQLKEAIMASCEVTFTLLSSDGEQQHTLAPLGAAGPDAWHYALALDGLALRPGSCYGLMLHYQSQTGGNGQYRVGRQMLVSDERKRLPLADGGVQLMHVEAVGGLALLVN